MGQQPSKDQERLQELWARIDQTRGLLLSLLRSEQAVYDAWYNAVLDHYTRLQNEKDALLDCIGECRHGAAAEGCSTAGAWCLCGNPAWAACHWACPHRHRLGWSLLIRCGACASTPTRFLWTSPIHLQTPNAKVAPCQYPTPPLPSACHRCRSLTVSKACWQSHALLAQLAAVPCSRLADLLACWLACVPRTGGGGGGGGGGGSGVWAWWRPHPFPTNTFPPCSASRTGAVFCWRSGARHTRGWRQRAQGTARRRH